MSELRAYRPDELEAITSITFCEAAYLAANRDIADAVESGQLESGRMHYELFGRLEAHRKQVAAIALAARQKRFETIRAILREGLPYTEVDWCFDFLSDELKGEFAISDSPLIGENEYDGDALAIIGKHKNGLVLDCGAGSRRMLYDNVVNFEISFYPSTDVRGAGEVLPFADHSFDAVLSLNVLEHVRDPFMAAKELLRVLKPGGDLVIVVPLTQPTHGYPHHYYNMTAEGMLNLFGKAIDVERLYVPESTTAIWSINWILRDWAEELDGETLEEFKQVTFGDVLKGAHLFADRSFVKRLSEKKQLDIASSTTLIAKKR